MILFLSDCMVRAVTQVWQERQVIFSTGQLTDGLPRQMGRHRTQLVGSCPPSSLRAIFDASKTNTI